MPPFFNAKMRKPSTYHRHMDGLIILVKKKTANHLVCGLDVSDMIRTRDLLIRSQTLYPAELHSHIRFEQNL